ncbi:peptide ligase PGM1-related protein [Amycolatopsis sp. NPDC059021]|uniref:preATP grasp domain-containing protein n=1 Tax=Amycolatopsis sp. NPDC059021 TaxID=3346704 RepID=UPI00366A6BBD
MGRLVVGNWSNEAGYAELSAESRRHIGAQGQRMLWDARAGDTVVLPIRPPDGVLPYVAELLGIDPGSIEVVVPPEAGLPDVLTAGRLADPGFVSALAGHVRDRALTGLHAFYLDTTVNQLTRELGLEHGTTGFTFMDQGGNELGNSKVVFRAMSGGIGLPVPDGVVADRPETVVDFAWRLLSAGGAVIVKQDVNVAGFGNEVLLSRDDVEVAGALRSACFGDRAALDAHVRERWDWYTHGGRRRVVVEHYIPGAVPLWGEVAITDDGVEVLGHGQIRMKPVIEGVLIPVRPETAESPAFSGFLAELIRLAGALRAIGYRGLNNIDAMLVPDGRILFNEFNARCGGSTHLFTIGSRVVGGDYLADRCLIERREVAFPEFDLAVKKLSASGLAYDPLTRTGVVIAVSGTRPDGTGGEACVIGEDVASAEILERELLRVFPD